MSGLYSNVVSRFSWVGWTHYTLVSTPILLLRASLALRRQTLKGLGWCWLRRRMAGVAVVKRWSDVLINEVHRCRRRAPVSHLPTYATHLVNSPSRNCLMRCSAALRRPQRVNFSLPPSCYPKCPNFDFRTAHLLSTVVGKKRWLEVHFVTFTLQGRRYDPGRFMPSGQLQVKPRCVWLQSSILNLNVITVLFLLV